MWNKHKRQESDQVSTQVRQAHADNEAAADKLMAVLANLVAPITQPTPARQRTRTARH